MSVLLQRYAFDPAVAALFFAVAIGLAFLLVRLFDWLGGYCGEVVRPSASKLASLEGLRGILAASVVAHHAYAWYFFSQNGAWSTGSSVIFSRFAGFGVEQFFFLSGFLFWRKLMKTGSIPFGNFYLSRFVRIGPAYYACVGSALLLGLFTSGFTLKVGAGTLLGSLLAWLLFSLGGRPSVNNFDMLRITCGVTWTLALEWQFYLALPFLGWFSRKARRLVPLALALAGLYAVGLLLRFRLPEALYSHEFGTLLDGWAKLMLTAFGGGILIATLELRIRGWVRLIRPGMNWMLLALYLAFLMIPDFQGPGMVLLLVGFALVVEGADLFGFLTSRAVRLLGVISYPLYLVHGIVYFAAMKLRGGLHPVAPFPYMAQTTLALAAILLLATLIHLVVERPTMKLSEKIARRAKLPQTGLLDQPAARENAG